MVTVSKPTTRPPRGTPINEQSLNGIAAGLILTGKGTRAGVRGGMVFVTGNSILPPDGAAATTA